ncbi:MAG: MFS transporter [Rhodothermales bacterium]
MLTATAGSPPPFSRVAPYIGVFFVLGLAPAALGPTLPALAEQTGVTLKSIGFVFTARMVGYMVMTFFIGRLIDGRAGHPLIGGALGTMAAIMLLVPHIHSLPLLLLLLVFHGSASATADIGTNTLLLRTFREKVGPYLNGLHFCFGAGAFLAPILVAQAFRFTGHPLFAYLGIGVLAIPVAIWVIRIPSPEVTVRPHGHVEARPDLRTMSMLVFFFFMYAGIEAGFSGWIYTYAIERGLARVDTAAYLNSTFWGGLMVGRLMSVYVSRRYLPRQILRVHLIWAIVSIGMVAASTVLPALIWVGALNLGLAASTIFPTALAFAERNIPLSGNITSRFYLGSSIGSMTLPLLTGFLIDAVSPEALTIMVGVCAFAALADMQLIIGMWKKS